MDDHGIPSMVIIRLNDTDPQYVRDYVRRRGYRIRVAAEGHNLRLSRGSCRTISVGLMLLGPTARGLEARSRRWRTELVTKRSKDRHAQIAARRVPRPDRVCPSWRVDDLSME